jgi:hypothetical protein
MHRTSKLQLHSELDRPRSTQLVQWTQASVSASTPQTSTQHRGGLSEEPTAEIAEWISEIRMIEQIRAFGSELEIKSFIQFEASAKSDIHLR